MPMASIWEDVRDGLRMLAKSPGFTAIAVLAVALEIGATTTIFGVIDSVLLECRMVRRVVVRLPAVGVTSQRAAYGPISAFTTQQHAQDPPRKGAGFERLLLPVSH
jgi:hypothetical protein